MWKQIMNWYNTKPLVQSFVSGFEGAAVAALASWSGGIPVGKAGVDQSGRLCGQSAVWLGKALAAAKRGDGWSSDKVNGQC